MRMRNKPWAKPELEACPFFIKDTESIPGHWLEHFPHQQPFHIELGCGKGGFMAQAATVNTDINFLALDLEFKMLGVARRKIAAAYEEMNLAPENILLCAYNIEKISDLFLPDEKICDRIYINFCNPWPRKKHQKHRLTHPRQLVQYRGILKDGAEIHFKTDDDDLFNDSLGYFEECGFSVTFRTYDLHSSGYAPNIITEHEKMFSDEGIKIKFLIAKKN